MTAPDDLARTLADEVDGIALIIASTSGSAGAPALTAAEAIVEHLASVVSRRDADLQAKAWDEGYMQGMRDEVNDVQHEADNPYWSRPPADTDTGRGQ